MSSYTHYDEQVGCGVGRVYIGAPHQRGSGVGSFLGGVFRYVLPLLKRSAKAVGKEALKAGFNIAADVGEKKTLSKKHSRHACVNHERIFRRKLKIISKNS